MTGFTRLRRESGAYVHSAGRQRAVVLELDASRPSLLGFRLKRTKAVYYLPVDWCYREAVRNELARRKAERARLRAAAAVAAHKEEWETVERLAYRVGQHADRSWWSGHISDGFGGLAFGGSSRGCEVEAHAVRIALAPRWAEALGERGEFHAQRGITAAVYGGPVRPTACRSALVPAVIAARS